ncbi:calcium-binding protein [Shinella sp. M27]|uniref:calcium-binding protein n=1 Tax=Shinella sp. M27 TaxID=3368614 RepID=UPI003B9FBDC2
MATINGGEGNDTLTGSSGGDSINGRGGNDTIDGKAGNDTIFGGGGDDVIYGGSGNDVIYGGQTNSNEVNKDFGSNTIYGGEGDDYIVADIDVTRNGYGTPLQSLKQIVYGGAGNDTIIGVSSAGEFYGEDGNDQFIGAGKIIDMGAGDDNVVLTNALGDDSSVAGGAGADTITFETASFGRLASISGFEVWRLLGLNYFSELFVVDSNFQGIVTLTIDGENTAYGDNHVVNASAVTLGSVNYTGGKGDNSFFAGAKADRFVAGEGNDTFKGGAGNDYFDGGDGGDVAVYSGNYANYSIVEITYNRFSVRDNIGTEGTDTIIDVNKLQFADQTVDVVIRGMEIIGDETAEVIEGGDETDHLDGAGGNDVLDGGKGNDLLDGGTGNDTLNGAKGNDFMNGGTGADAFFGGAGNDRLNGGSGDDLANYSSVKADLDIDLSAGQSVGDGVDTLISIEDVVGGSGNDTIVGSAASNEIKAGSGNDYVDAGAGDDLIVGGDGAGNDRYIGGSGIDTIKYTSAKSSITVNLYATSNQARSTLAADAAGIGIDQLLGIENVIAGSYADILTGNSAANTLSGGAGNDVIDGGAGSAADVLDGGSGVDTVSYRALTSTKSTGVMLNLSGAKDADGYFVAAGLGGADKIKNIENITGSAYADTLTGNGAANVLSGGGGKDVLTGMAGDDVLKGGEADDLLVGGAGADDLYGGAGADRFVFKTLKDSGGATSTRDTIFDFSAKEGDKIDLRTLDADTKTAGDQKFAFIGNSAFTKKFGELRYEIKNGDTFVHGDVNGDGKADFSLRFDASIKFSGGDFLL